MGGTSRWDAIDRRILLLAAAIVAMAAVAGTLSWSPLPESELPYPGAVRDVALEKQAVVAAFNGELAPTDHLRAPGAVVLLMPLLATPDMHATWTAALTSVAGMVLIVAATARLVPRKGLLVALLAPLTVAFSQAILHGSLFPLVAAAIVWIWVAIEEDRQVFAGILVAVAATMRLWPALLAVPLLLGGKRKAVSHAVGWFVVLNVIGLQLPGITIENTVATLASSQQSWLSASHNGSLASWLPVDGTWAVVAGFGVIISIWILGLSRFRTTSGRLAWTTPAAILASPLAWLPYLLVLTPVMATYSSSKKSTRLLMGVVALLVFGFRFMPAHSWTITTSLVIVWGVVFAVGDAPFLVPMRQGRRSLTLTPKRSPVVQRGARLLT